MTFDYYTEMVEPLNTLQRRPTAGASCVNELTWCSCIQVELFSSLDSENTHGYSEDWIPLIVADRRLAPGCSGQTQSVSSVYETTGGTVSQHVTVKQASCQLPVPVL